MSTSASPAHESPHYSLADVADAPSRSRAKQVQPAKVPLSKQRRVLHLLTLGGVGALVVLRNTPAVLSALETVKRLIEVEPVEEVPDASNVRDLEVPETADALQRLLQSVSMKRRSPPSLEDFVIEIRKLARPELTESELDRTSKAAAGVLRNKGGQPLTDVDRAELRTAIGNSLNPEEPSLS